MFNIALDGPSGAGKSTVAKLLAKKLSILYLDTGAMYRAIGWKINKIGLTMDNIDEIISVTHSTLLDIVLDNGEQKVICDGLDVSNLIREHNISKIASDVSAIAEVRIRLVEDMRRIASSNSSILDGRDIGSYVLPNAKYKFYITADVDERAKRRFQELRAKGSELTFEQVKQDIVDRDYNDSTRSFAPLVKVADAIEIDTSNLTINEVVERILEFIKE